MIVQYALQMMIGDNGQLKSTYYIGNKACYISISLMPIIGRGSDAAACAY